MDELPAVDSAINSETVETVATVFEDTGIKKSSPIAESLGVQPGKKSSDPGGEDESEEAILFSCNICYEVASEPVVTVCGHLYCWPCLYRWLRVQNQSKTCPVCKAGVEKDKVIPIYGRGGNEDPRIKSKDIYEIPSRPLGQRPPPVARGAMMTGNTQLHGQQGLGIIPTLFGLQSGPGQGYAEPLTPEQQHQAFLSRLLLMLGSFVIMCLLLF